MQKMKNVEYLIHKYNQKKSKKLSDSMAFDNLITTIFAI